MHCPLKSSEKISEALSNRVLGRGRGRMIGVWSDLLKDCYVLTEAAIESNPHYSRDGTIRRNMFHDMFVY